MQLLASYASCLTLCIESRRQVTSCLAGFGGPWIWGCVLLALSIKDHDRGVTDTVRELEEAKNGSQATLAGQVRLMLLIVACLFHACPNCKQLLASSMLASIDHDRDIINATVDIYDPSPSWNPRLCSASYPCTVQAWHQVK